MPKYFDASGNEVTLEALKTGAAASNMELNEYMDEFGFTASEGKLNGSAETTPPTEPEKKTAAGDSSLADTSLESQDLNPVDKALKRLAAVNISEDYLALEENIDTPEKVAVKEMTPKGILMATGEFYDVYVYDDFIEPAKRKLGEGAKPEDITAEAKAMYLKTAKSDLFNAKVEEILEDFDDDIYSPLGRLKKYMPSLFPAGPITEAEIQKAKLQSEVEKSRQNAIAEIDRLSKNKIAEEAYLETSAIKLNQIGEKYKKDPASITQEEIDEYKDLSKSYNDVYESYKATNEELANTIETGQNLEELVDLTARSYDNLDIAVGRVSAAALNASGNILNFAREISPDKIKERITGEEATGYVPFYVAGIPVKASLNLLSTTGDALVKEAENITGKIEKRQELSKVKSVEDFLEFGLDLFTEQAVNTAITAGVPSAGLGLIAASASGEKFRTMQEEMDNGEKISPLRFYTAGIMYGAGEYITEKIALDQFLAAKKSIKKSFDLSRTDLTQNPMTTLKALETWGTGLNKEGSAELGSQLISNWADRWVLDKKEVGIWDGIGEAYLSGAIMSGLGFGAPSLINNIYSAATTGNEQAAANRRSARVIEITNKINDLQSGNINDLQVQEAIGALQEEADGLIKENLAAMKLAEARIDELSKSDKSILLNIDSQIYKAKGAIDRINANKNLSRSEKESLIAKHANTITNLEFRKDDVLGQSEASRSRAKAKVFQMKTAAQKGLNFEYIYAKTTKEGIDKAIEAVDKKDISDEDKTKLKEELLKAKEAIEKGEMEFYGIFAGAEFNAPIAIVSQEGERRNQSVSAHEVSHATLFRKLFEGNSDIIGLAQDLRKHMIDTYGEIAKRKFDRIDAAYGRIENATKPRDKADIAEELMAGVVELSRRFDLKTNANKTLQGKLLSRWNKIFKGESLPTEIKTGKDVLAAIESFNASFDTGEIKGLTEKIFKGEVKAKLAEFKQRQEGTKFSMSKSAERAKAQLEKMQAEGYDPNSYELYEALQGMVGAQLSKYQAKGLQITDEEEAVSDVVSRLYTQRDVNKFDGRGSAYGYLNGRIKFRILDAFKANPVWVENFENIDLEGLEGKSTRKLAEEDVEVETEVIQPAVIEAVEEPSVSAKPEYKNLIRRRVVEPEVIKSIEGKVLRTVRLLKSRIDAKVSKNVTVTPIIKEIKNEMGKQADIDLKTAMGGKKDGELRKFLLRNKAAILENMSTTWLSTAMPIAVQKSVNGVWTSDWKGKKIDREKTTTDLAGRTSGADLVRRLPRAAIVISDADFLATILQPDGNPIRGKKESLAKAMAEELSFDIIKEALQDPNSPIAQALIENQQRLGVENAENLGPEFVRQSERGNVKYSLSKKQQDNYKKSTVSEILFNIDAKRRFYNNTIDETLKGQFGKENGRYNLKNEEDLYKFINIFKEKIAPNFPKEFFFPENSIYTSLIGNADSHGMRKNAEQFKKFRDIIKTELGLDEKNNPIPGVKPIKWGPPLKNLEGYRIKGKNGKLLTQENILETEEELKEYMKAGDVLRYNRMVETIHREMWLRFNSIIQEEMKDPNSNGEAARFIGTYIASSHSDSNHPQRMGAGIAGYSKGYGTFKNIIKEHASPNSFIGRILLETALQKPNPLTDFERDYRFITRNYVLIAFKKEFNKILDETNLKEAMPADYDPINGNYGERYFNKETGLNPEELILMSGNSYASVAGVDENGKYISDKLINFIKNTSDERFAKIIKDFKSKNEIVKSKISSALAQTALIEDRFVDGQRKYSKGFPPAQVLNGEFNRMLERGSGISAEQQFSRIRGQLAGKGKGRFKFFIAPGADDFRGLVHYAFAGKGAQGDRDMAFFEKNLMEPYFKGVAAIDTMRQQIKREFKVVTTEFKEEYKMLSEPIAGTPFTYDHALRVYMWASQGTNIPGLSAEDQSLLEDAILDNPQLADLGEALMIVGRKETWPKPSEFWEGDSVLADLNSMTEKIGRKEILAQFIENADAIFSEENLNKIEAIKGRAHREAIEDALYSMKSGVNRPSGANRQMNKWLNWINGSTGAIMFFNRRSALLQMLSFTNFINWSDNNPAKAAMAFADQAQYWKDWVYLFNSDKLKERRGGLKQDVSDSEIAQVAGRSKNSPQAILAYLLKIGFTPTQIADSMAIATGGATYYRNRINTYLKQGKSLKEAEEQAFLDFSKVSDEAQQSSDPALVSQQQRSVLGRLVLAFANTPMQYTRLMKKAGQDLINGRGDWKTNVSKIAYYGFIQNFIFSALQSALFALMFDDEEEDTEKAKQIREKKIARTFDSMLDTILRGSGIYGAVASTIKNTIKTYIEQEEKGYMSDHAYTLLSALNLSPPIGSKLRKLYGAIQTKRFEADNMKERGWAITADGRLNLGPNWAITGSVVSGALNVPLDRVVAELTSIAEAFDERNKTWQRIALALGWKTWDVGARNEEADLIEVKAKEKRKEEGIQKAKETKKAKRGTKEDRAQRAAERRKRNK